MTAVTPNTFHFLGVPALIGRTATSDDTQPGAVPVAILSYAAWMKYFSANRSVIGRKIVLDNKAMNLIGVLPPHFAWNNADVWIPEAASLGDPDGKGKGFWLQARLEEGIGVSQAEAELYVIAKRLAQRYPDRYPRSSRSESSMSSTRL